jgi:hypothetical protein
MLANPPARVTMKLVRDTGEGVFACSRTSITMDRGIRDRVRTGLTETMEGMPGIQQRVVGLDRPPGMAFMERTPDTRRMPQTTSAASG